VTDNNKKRIWTSRIISALWGGLLGAITGTAISSALARVIKSDWLRILFVNGLDIKVPYVSSSLGYFNLSFGFGIRLTLLSALLGVTSILLLLLVRFKNE